MSRPKRRPPAPVNGERQWLLQADHAASRDFDKAIMTLAAGALGVSIAFVHDVAPHPVRVAWLGWAWGLFAASLVLILLSFLDQPARAAPGDEGCCPARGQTHGRADGSASRRSG